MTEAFKLKDEEGIEVHSVFERNLSTVATVNVDPDDAVDAREILEGMGYRVTSMEELIDVTDGTRFTRINLKRVEE